MAETDQKQTQMWGMLCHLTALAGFVGIPFGNILGPLIVWLIKKGDAPFIDDQGKESLNFQITMSILGIIAAILMFIVIGIFLLIGLAIVDVVFIVLASISANKGETYRYPFALRLIK